MNFYDNINEFYENFYKHVDKDLKKYFALNHKEIKNRKIAHPFYSIDDIKFRLVRNNLLTKDQYENIMFKMFDEKKFYHKKLYQELFFHKKDLKTIDRLGHVVGMHSHNHPTSLKMLSYKDQKNEYEKCLSSISKILNKPKNQVKCMSHPCGSYNNDTLEILNQLGIELGFKNIISLNKEKSRQKFNLEISRANHSNILKMFN